MRRNILCYFGICIVVVGIISCTIKNQISDTSKFVTVTSEKFIYDEAPFPECHASSIEELSGGKLMAVWFGGTREKHPDVTIWSSIYDNNKWSPIKELADGIQNSDQRYPCWNPVLFKHSSGTLYLFYKVGPSPREWWGELISSSDEGQSWTSPKRIPEGNLGPIRAKPIELKNGKILCPSSEEFVNGPWKVHMEIFDAKNNTWEKILVDHNSSFNAIQPTLLRHSESKLQIMCRSQENRIVESWSEDNGMSWDALKATTLPNPSAGIDAVTLNNGKQLLIYNPTEDGPNDRAKLSLAISDDGLNWKNIYELENQPKGEFSYPAMIQTNEGQINISYTWNRKKIKHVSLSLNVDL